MKITEAMNAWEPALLTLLSLGCTLFFDIDDDTEDKDLQPMWVAELGGVTFVASNPLSLLGLVAMWKKRGEHWEIRADERRIYDRLLDGDVVKPDSAK